MHSTHTVGRALHQMLPRGMWVLGPHAIPTVADVSCAHESVQDRSLCLFPQPQHEMCAVFEYGRLDWQQVVPPWSTHLHS